MHPAHRPKIFGEIQAHSHHDHSQPHRVEERRKLLFCILLTGIMMVVEVIGGVFSRSLALLTDAGHMLTDLFTLAMSFFAILIASRPVNYRKTYGYFRAEILTALFNGVLLIGISLFIFYEAYQRIRRPVQIYPREMLVIALIGLLVNLISGYFLYEVRGKDLNLKGAFFHVLSDALSSLAVVIGALVIWGVGWLQIDPILSILIGTLVLFWAFKLVRDSIHILMESTTKHIDMKELLEIMKREVGGIKEIHDVHIWEITTHMYAMTAHVTVEECSLSECMKKTEIINLLLSERFHIEHVNLQYEC